MSLVAVRTHATVSVVKLPASAVMTEGGPIAATTVTPIFLSDTGYRRVVDISCNIVSSSAAQALLVNDMGGVYNCKVQGENKTMLVQCSCKHQLNAKSVLRTIASNAEESEDTHVDHFWRIVRRDTSTCIRTSYNRVHLFDLRVGTDEPLPNCNEMNDILPGSNGSRIGALSSEPGERVHDIHRIRIRRTSRNVFLHH